MTDTIDDEKNKIRRAIGMEVIRMEDDADLARDARLQIVGKLTATIGTLQITNAEGRVDDDTGTSLQVITTTLKALNDLEAGTHKAIGVKLKQQEQQIASSQATKERLEIVLQATRPGRLEATFPTEDLEAHLEEMFGDSIQDFELRSSSRDIAD